MAVEIADIENYEPVRLLTEARMIADIYREILEGSPIGVGAGLGGLIPEKLLWTQIEAYCRVNRMKLNRWITGLLFAVDSIRLRSEFERMAKEAKKAK